MRKKQRRAPKVSRGSLSLIASLLIGSAILRVIAGSGEAWAKVEAQFQGQGVSAHSQTSESPPASCEPEEDYAEMLDAFQRRAAALDKREASIEKRMEVLTNADREITVKLEELRQAEADLARTLAFADQAAERDIDKLVAVYAAMKPKNAAALFEEMEPNFAAGFLARMQPEAAAGVMAGLSAEAAYTISVVMAGRNVDVPKE